MFSLRGLLTTGIALFAGYVFYVEPNASDDPVGAISRATTRLATICERNPHECEYVGDLGTGIGRAGEIGWGLVTGQGRLVYVPAATRRSAVDCGPYGDRHSARSGDYAGYRAPRDLFGGNGRDCN